MRQTNSTATKHITKESLLYEVSTETFSINSSISLVLLAKHYQTTYNVCKSSMGHKKDF